MNAITVHGKTYKIPEKLVWRKGPPPEIGWWPASVQKHYVSIRWWDGKCWSINCSYRTTKRQAGFSADIKEPGAMPYIEWTDQWWNESKEQQ
jgi:hypothetical protein